MSRQLRDLPRLQLLDRVVRHVEFDALGLLNNGNDFVPCIDSARDAIVLFPLVQLQERCHVLADIVRPREGDGRVPGRRDTSNVVLCVDADGDREEVRRELGDVVVEENAVVDGCPFHVCLAERVQDGEAKTREGNVGKMSGLLARSGSTSLVHPLVLVDDGAPQIRDVALHARARRCLDQIQVWSVVHARVHGGDDGGHFVVFERFGDAVDVGVVGGEDTGTGVLCEFGILLYTR